MNRRNAVSTARDPRIDELSSGGLSWRWVAIADAIGYDAFVCMWRLTTQLFEGSDMDRTGMVRVLIPNCRSLDRMQRNKLIFALNEEGLSCREIHNEIHSRIGCSITTKHIKRILRDHRAK